MSDPPHRIVPAPITVEPLPGPGYELTPDTVVHGPLAAAERVAELLRPATGYPVPAGPDPRPGIALRLDAPAELTGDEGYLLEVTEAGVLIRAHRTAGLWYGAQTLRQLLPPAIEAPTRQPGPWPVPAVRVSDRPRFGYRGAMLDVARHFFDVPVVTGFLDRLARYKLNHLHLHLTDDQGWRVAIESWPELARRGGASQVGGGPGGFYTRDAFATIVAYAAARHITIVPEIDLPGHTNAALSAYPELNRDGAAPPPYTGMKVGFSSLDADLPVTYRFVADVLGELAALAPGPYLHIGGDEAFATPARDYATFLSQVQPIVTGLGRTVMGWHEIGAVDHAGPRVLQYWRPERADPRVTAAVAGGATVVLSPANRAYLDMKYDDQSPVGLTWAGPVEVRDSYDWDPTSYLADVPATAVRGVEAALWSETVTTPAEIDYLLFPRLPALAEVGWSAPAVRDWAGFRTRLAGHAPRWQAAGITYYPSPQIPWDPVRSGR